MFGADLADHNTSKTLTFMVEELGKLESQVQKTQRNITQFILDQQNKGPVFSFSVPFNNIKLNPDAFKEEEEEEERNTPIVAAGISGEAAEKLRACGFLKPAKKDDLELVVQMDAPDTSDVESFIEETKKAPKVARSPERKNAKTSRKVPLDIELLDRLDRKTTMPIEDAAILTRFRKPKLIGITLFKGASAPHKIYTDTWGDLMVSSMQWFSKNFPEALEELAEDPKFPTLYKTPAKGRDSEGNVGGIYFSHGLSANVSLTRIITLCRRMNLANSPTVHFNPPVLEGEFKSNGNGDKLLSLAGISATIKGITIDGEFTKCDSINDAYYETVVGIMEHVGNAPMRVMCDFGVRSEAHPELPLFGSPELMSNPFEVISDLWVNAVPTVAALKEFMGALSKVSGIPTELTID